MRSSGGVWSILGHWCWGMVEIVGALGAFFSDNDGDAIMLAFSVGLRAR